MINAAPGLPGADLQPTEDTKLNVLVIVALACVALLIVGVLSAHYLLPIHADEEAPPVFDLLERKLNVLSAEVSAGWLSEEKRRRIVDDLIRNADTIATMEDLLKLGPAGSMADAEIIHKPEALELMIWVHHGYVQTWLCRLYELGYTDKLCDGPYPQLRGAVTVTLAQRARVTPLVNVRREVAA